MLRPLSGKGFSDGNGQYPTKKAPPILIEKLNKACVAAAVIFYFITPGK